MKDVPPPGTCMAGGLALGAAVALAYWQHYQDNVAAPPRLWLADGPLREKVLPHCSALLRPFAPTPWAANRHAQTVLGFLRTLTMRNRYNRQLILTVDGATLGLDWFDGCDAADFPLAPSAPVLLVCHGINGGSHEGYAKWVCAAALARGWRAAVLNYRGCNGLPFTAPRGYAATMSHDVFTAVYSVKARYPAAPLVAVGYSLGGLKLTKYVAEADVGLHPPAPGQPHLFTGSGLAAVAVVSSPVSLGLSAIKLSDPTSLSFLYNLAVAYKLREHIAEHRSDIEARTRFDVDAALAAWTVGGIEERGLPASLGFADRQQYYEEASSLEYIPAITTPTLILLAEDDPFLGIVPDVECSRNPATLLALTRRGGHVAFLQGAWPLGKSYMDDAVMEFFAATLEHLHGYRPPPAAAPQGGSGGGGGTQALVTAPTAPLQAGDAAAAAEPVREIRTHRMTDAARAGAVAAAVAAAGRSCPVDGCCGGLKHYGAAGAAAAAAGVQRPRPTAATAPPPLPPSSDIGASTAPDVAATGRQNAVATPSVRAPHAQICGAAAAPHGSSGTAEARLGAAAVNGGGALACQVLPSGDNAARLRLMVQLQRQLEQRRWDGAAAAAPLPPRSKL